LTGTGEILGGKGKQSVKGLSQEVRLNSRSERVCEYEKRKNKSGIITTRKYIIGGTDYPVKISINMGKSALGGRNWKKCMDIRGKKEPAPQGHESPLE